MLDIAKALEIKIRPYYGKTRTQYKYLCFLCDKEIWYRISELKRVSGKCGHCSKKETIKKALDVSKISNRKRPYERLFNLFIRMNKDRTIEIYYEDFIEFLKNNKCHYCNKTVQRTMHGNGSQAYYLDRKNNDIGYLKDNVVTCCTRCNYAKSDKFSYEEWFGMCSYMREKTKI